VLGTELFGTPSESLRFFATAGGGGIGTGGLSPCATPLAASGVRTRPASRSTLGVGMVIGPESVALVSPENFGLKPVFLAQEEGGIGLGSGGDGAIRLRLLGSELDMFGISYKLCTPLRIARSLMVTDLARGVAELISEGSRVLHSNEVRKMENGEWKRKERVWELSVK